MAFVGAGCPLVPLAVERGLFDALNHGFACVIDEPFITALSSPRKESSSHTFTDPLTPLLVQVLESRVAMVFQLELVVFIALLPVFPGGFVGGVTIDADASRRDGGVFPASKLARDFLAIFFVPVYFISVEKIS